MIAAEHAAQDARHITGPGSLRILRANQAAHHIAPISTDLWPFPIAVVIYTAEAEELPPEGQRHAHNN
jgi:hypothetical protein